MVKVATNGLRQGAARTPFYNAFTGGGVRVSLYTAFHSRGRSFVFVELATGLPGTE